MELSFLLHLFYLLIVKAGSNLPATVGVWAFPVALLTYEADIMHMPSPVLEAPYVSPQGDDFHMPRGKLTVFSFIGFENVDMLTIVLEGEL